MVIEILRFRVSNINKNPIRKASMYNFNLRNFIAANNLKTQ